jgi:putative ABC transport system substrate-binding protein
MRPSWVITAMLAVAAAGAAEAQPMAIPRVGVLFSYGPDIDVIVRHAATHVQKVLKGARPSDTPVEHPTKFELIINMKTARAYGVTVPPAIVARVDKTIE